MSKEVVRYLVKAGSECSEMVYASDYDALLEENQRLESAWKVDVLNRKDELIAKQEKENDRVKAERDALLAERTLLRDALEHCIDSLGSEYALPPECIKQARAALQGEQP